MLRHTCYVLGFSLFIAISGVKRSNAAERQSGSGLKDVPKIAVIASVYYHNSHADIIAGRMVEGKTLDGKGDYPRLKFASLYVDQFPENDKSRQIAEKYAVPMFDTIAEALTLGTGELAVDGVLLICEHGDYPVSDTGNIIYPKRKMFSEIVKVFESSQRVVPVYCDKHLADNWQDAKAIYDTAGRMKIPMMAGSSLPVLWRYPAIDLRRGAKVKEIVATSYHRLDIYGFHALEAVQALAERRAGGETGIRSVQCLEGQAVWEAGRKGLYDQELLQACFSRLRERPLKPGVNLEETARTPSLMIINYRDGLRVTVFTEGVQVVEWTAAWRDPEAGGIQSTCFWTQEARPFMHFSFLLDGIEPMMHTGEPTWPVERTLLTSSALDALLISRKQGGKLLETPHLDIHYKSKWNFRQPPPPPADRPIRGK